jgi:hypothetical protein
MLHEPRKHPVLSSPPWKPQISHKASLFTITNFIPNECESRETLHVYEYSFPQWKFKHDYVSFPASVSSCYVMTSPSNSLHQGTEHSSSSSYLIRRYNFSSRKSVVKQPTDQSSLPRSLTHSHDTSTSHMNSFLQEDTDLIFKSIRLKTVEVSGHNWQDGKWSHYFV